MADKNPSRLSPADLAQMLRAAGSTSATAELVQADIDEGSPTNSDGTVNLIHYAAWLVSEVDRGN